MQEPSENQPIVDDVEDQPEPVLKEAEPIPDTAEPEPAPPPAVIHSAQYDEDGVTVVLQITEAGESEQKQYALNATDPHGLAPFLREQLATMTAEGFIILPAE